MGVVAVVGVVLDMCRGNRDTSLSLLRCLIDGAIIEILRIALFGLTFRDRRSEGSLAVINVTNRPCISSASILYAECMLQTLTDVYMRFISLEDLSI